jgi:hypothetical protein
MGEGPYNGCEGSCAACRVREDRLRDRCGLQRPCPRSLRLRGAEGPEARPLEARGLRH